jgi:hypothetical protein
MIYLQECLVFGYKRHISAHHLSAKILPEIDENFSSNLKQRNMVFGPGLVSADYFEII